MVHSGAGKTEEQRPERGRPPAWLQTSSRKEKGFGHSGGDRKREGLPTQNVHARAACTSAQQVILTAKIIRSPVACGQVWGSLNHCKTKVSRSIHVNLILP